MKIQSIRKPSQVVSPIEVVIDDIDENVTESDILRFGMSAAHETRASLFGWNVHWNGGDTAVVKLYRD